jgi:hypothetical protein
VTKAKISEYDASAGNNTDVNGVNIAEGCAPSGINNAIREVMAALKRFETGTDGDGITVGGNLIVSGSSTANTLSATNVTVSGTLGVTGASTFTGTIAALNKLTLSSAIHEARVDLSTATEINVGQANYFIRTISTDTTFTVTGTPATGTVASFILDLTNGGSATITWVTGTVWSGGTAPTLTASGRDVLGFFTHNGGGTINGFVLGTDLQ